MKKIYALIAFTFISALLLGFAFGRYHTIRQAELIGVNPSEYYITFGNSVHIYENNMGVE